MTASSDLILLPLIVARRQALRSGHAAARAAMMESTERARLASEANPSDRRARAEWRHAEATARTEEITAHVERLRTLLESPASFEAIDFESLKDMPLAPPFNAQGLDESVPHPKQEIPAEPSGLLARFFPSIRARHLAAIESAKETYERSVREHAEKERERARRLAELEDEHRRAIAEANARVEGQHRSVESFRVAFQSDAPDALVALFVAVLATSDYPEGFPRHATIAMDPPAGLLVVDYELPGLEVVPAAESFKYDQAIDRIEEVPRPPARRKDLYALVVAEVALRSVRELFAADPGRTIREIAFNGYVHGIDRATDEAVRPYLVSLRTSREEFGMLEVTKTDPMVSIRNLEASFSTNPAELAPVRQITGVHSVGTRHMAATPD